MTTETKTETAPVKKPATRKKKPARTVKTRDDAIAVFIDMNIPFDNTADDVTLIAKAEQVPVEKWFKIFIEPKDDEFATRQAFAKVNGKSYRIERGVEVDVPERVVLAFRNGVTSIVEMTDTVQGKKVVQRERRDEVLSVLEEVPNPKVK